MKNILITILGLLLLGGSWYYYSSQKYEVIKVELPPAQEYQDFEESFEPEIEPVEEGAPINEDDEEGVPPTDLLADAEVLGEKIEEEPGLLVIDNINLAVPFISQAPSGNWDQPFQDACEEASVLMVDYYYQEKDFPSQVEVESILLEMVGWQEENLGGHFDLPTAEVSEYAQATFGYQTEVINDLTAEKIRSLLNQGIPVIIPADGHKLENPFFSNDGPDYHMLVIKGYVDDKFITNDPGTRHGADFVYTEENLMYSIGDWDKDAHSATGPKLGLVLYRK